MDGGRGGGLGVDGRGGCDCGVWMGCVCWQGNIMRRKSRGLGEGNLEGGTLCGEVWCVLLFEVRGQVLVVIW